MLSPLTFTNTLSYSGDKLNNSDATSASITKSPLLYSTPLSTNLLV